MPAAARILDNHVCPLPLHKGGPIAQGCPTVLIGGLPAARVGDQATCNGPSDAIAKGSPAVLIGGQQAARLGDQTMHGGMIVAGCPTVIIGTSGRSSCLACAAAAGSPFVSGVSVA